MGLRDQVERTIRRHAMLAGGETVLVAVSGGADSVALLHLLLGLGPEWRLRLHVLHVDHQLRADSAADAEFVRARWPGVRRMAMLHRTGRLEIGEASVLIAVAAAHRGDAFEACRYAIDTLKRTVPVWKKEHFEDGEVWVGLQGG